MNPSNPSRSLHSDPKCDEPAYAASLQIGQRLQVHVKDGSIYTGIYHCTKADRKFAVVLKGAGLLKDGSLGGQSISTNSLGKAPWKTVVIPHVQIVQVTAESMPVDKDVAEEFRL